MLMLEVKLVKMYKNENADKLKAYVDVLIGEAIEIRGCKLIQGDKGLFVGLPRQKGKNDQWFPIVKIHDDELFREIQYVVKEGYKDV